MAQLATKKTEAEQAEPTAKPKPLEIEPSQVMTNSEGFEYRTLVVRAPEGMVADDLRQPAIWRRAQITPTSSLRKYDEIRVLAFDESWIAEAVVKMADSQGAYLWIKKVASFREIDETLRRFEDQEIFWDGGGFGVRRIADRVRTVPQSFLTEAQAFEALLKSLPKRAA